MTKSTALLIVLGGLFACGKRTSSDSVRASVDASLCGGGLGRDEELRRAPTAAPLPLAVALKELPSAGRFTVEGFVASSFACGPCPPGATCKPCVDTVLLSESMDSGLPSSPDVLRIRVHDGSKFAPKSRQRITFEVCGPSNLELRGYEPFD